MGIRKNVSTNENEEAKKEVIDTSKKQEVQNMKVEEAKKENKFVSGAKDLADLLKEMLNHSL